ncbi:hypothetical protein R5W23_005184 [Gemmata sp. JC673]|uniref:HEAT repeat domain-containing protein n=1 Tax=Gemmata algarum TaxID=2975278 RepID=A0ABU5F8H8_9BACT|nr:hypothetical protein [Gemmata algarum]MDY3563570.1 hypothetical protein [Gemmata algarum]
MSWRAGAELFADVWPLIQARVRNKRQRQEVTAGLLRLLVEHDVDPSDVADIHPEVRAALAAIGAEVPESGPGAPDEAVAGCIRQLVATDAKDRAAAAEALRHFVPEAREPNAAATAALPALAGLLSDPVPKVRREAAMSIRVLVRAGYPLPADIVANLRATTWDDEVVASRVRDALVAAGR